MSEFSRRPLILVVDDTPENIDVLSGILVPKYRVKVALSGEKAIQIATGTEQPDLILLDIMMPGMDGYEVCKTLKNDLRSHQIPILFVSARGEVEDEEYGFTVGAVDYITKPVSPPIVLARVHSHLELYNQQRALARMVKERTSEIYETRLEIFQRLGVAAEFKDDDTGTHIIRMSRYCYQIAIGYGMDEHAAELILNAAPMHDVGKIGIPDHILQKPGSLTPEEWETMKTHTTIGGRILSDGKAAIMRLAHNIAMTHHEKWDGSGYPRGLSGENIPIEGRIVALADVFDALTSDRPYKDAWPVDKALEYIRANSGKHFDPVLTEIFLEQVPALLAIKNELSNEGEAA